MEFWQHHAKAGGEYRRMKVKLTLRSLAGSVFERVLAKLSAHLRHIGGHFFFGLIGWSPGFGSVASSFSAFRRALRSGLICSSGMVTPLGVGFSLPCLSV